MMAGFELRRGDKQKFNDIPGTSNEMLRLSLSLSLSLILRERDSAQLLQQRKTSAAAARCNDTRYPDNNVLATRYAIRYFDTSMVS